MEDGSFLKALPPASVGPLALAFAPDARTLAVTYFDGRLGLYDLAAGTHRTLAAHTSVVLGLAYASPDLLITASQDGSTRFWDPSTGALLATVVSGADGRWLAIAPDGRVDGTPGDEGGASLLYWQVGDVQLPGYVAWERQHTPGLLSILLANRVHRLDIPRPPG